MVFQFLEYNQGINSKRLPIPTQPPCPVFWGDISKWWCFCCPPTDVGVPREAGKLVAVQFLRAGRVHSTFWDPEVCEQVLRSCIDTFMFYCNARQGDRKLQKLQKVVKIDGNHGWKGDENGQIKHWINLIPTKFSNLTVRWLINCILKTFSQSLLILCNQSCVCALLAWPTNKFIHNTNNYPTVTTLPAFSTYQKARLPLKMADAAKYQEN